MVTIDGDEVFYNYVESFTIWETFWLCVWSFSMFASSLCTLCYKVYNLVQTLVETQLVQSCKKATTSYHIANFNLTQKPNVPKTHMLGNKVYIVAPSPRFCNTCTHFQSFAIDPINVLATLSSKQTLVSLCG
jgi:hypothetical protein